MQASERTIVEAFGWMSPWLARGGQPDDDGYRRLERQAGITHVVNLRMRDETQAVLRNTRRAEPVHVPVRNDYAPTDDQALRWLDFCAARTPEAKIYVHCHAGHGRTSTFCILVAIARSEDVQSAIDKERAYGFDPGRKHRAQRDFLKAFAETVRRGEYELPPAEKF